MASSAHGTGRDTTLPGPVQDHASMDTTRPLKPPHARASPASPPTAMTTPIA